MQGKRAWTPALPLGSQIATVLTAGQHQPLQFVSQPTQDIQASGGDAHDRQAEPTSDDFRVLIYMFHKGNRHDCCLKHA